MRDQQPAGEQTSLWAGLAVGVAIAAALGVGGIILFLAFRRRDASAALPASGAGMIHGGALAAPPDSMYALPSWSSPNMITPLPAPTPAWNAPPQAAQGQSRESRLETFRLPTSAVRIATGHGPRSRAVVRVISPAGQFAMLSSDAAELNQASGAVPTGGIAIVPAGQHETFYLRGRQVLYAKGSTATVVLSVVMSEEAG